MMTHKPYRLVRGKSVKQWSESLGVKLVTAWSWYNKGTLESHIDGTHVPKIPKRWFDLTAAEIANRLGVAQSTVSSYVHDGTLERRLNGETIQPNYPPAPIVCNGKTAKQIQDELGISRQRVHQLKDRQALDDRLAGVDRYEKAMAGIIARTEAQRESYRQARRPGESVAQLAARIGVSYQKVKLAFPDKTPFAAERRALRTGNTEARLDSDKAIADQRLPGESVMQFARRIGMDAAFVRRACGGKVPFAAERRVLEAQRIIEATRKDN